MRVVQHKPPSQKEKPTTDMEDVTGLTVNIKLDFKTSNQENFIASSN